MVNQTIPQGAPKAFYIMSLKWTSGDHITWWRPNNAGYTSDLAQAGVYSAEQVARAPDYYNNGKKDGTLAVPTKAAERFVRPVMFVDNSLNIYRKLRAARNRARLAGWDQPLSPPPSPEQED